MRLDRVTVEAPLRISSRGNRRFSSRLHPASGSHELVELILSNLAVESGSVDAQCVSGRLLVPFRSTQRLTYDLALDFLQGHILRHPEIIVVAGRRSLDRGKQQIVRLQSLSFAQ